MAADEVIDALRAGQPVLLPTDTVYGLAASADDERGAEALYRLKGREQRQPVALLAASIEQLFDRLPELRGREVHDRARAPAGRRSRSSCRIPARRYPWLTGERPETIGVRVPGGDRRGAARARSGRLRRGDERERPGRAATRSASTTCRNGSAAGCGAELDAGRLPGIASTVLDFTGPEPQVLREGAAPSAEALARVRGASSS